MILDLQAIEARLEAAPEPEKWQVEEGWEGYRVFYKDDGPGDLPIAEEICQGTDSGEALAEFIAHAPEDIRALIDEVTDLRMKLEAAQFQIEEVKALHFPADLKLYAATIKECATCEGQKWPCPTMRALGVTEQ